MTAPLLWAGTLPPVSRRVVFRYAACPVPGEVEQALLSACLEEAEACLSPRALYLELPLSLSEEIARCGSLSLASAALCRHLAGCDRVVLFAATVGPGLDRLLLKYSRLSPARAVLLQALGAERVEALCDALCVHLVAGAQQGGRVCRARFSPGYADLPLSVQGDIFSLLDCPRRLGLSLTAGGLMTPTKSVTALVGLAPIP